METKVSVIIPVFNCEKYIGCCIEALINQTMKECEFIFINDGSTDCSLKIIEGYRREDPRIKIITQENKGVSIARNVGINSAIGKYIGFVDADDEVEGAYFKTLYEAAEKYSCDIVISDWYTFLQGKRTNSNLPFEKNKVLNKDYIEAVIYPFLLESDSFNSVCNKLYKRELIEQFNIYFPQGRSLGEDGIFNIKAITYGNTCYYLDYYGYFYREVQGSATRNIIGKDYFKKAEITYKEDIEEIKTWKISKEKIKVLKALKFVRTVMGIIYIYFLPSSNINFKNRYNYARKMVKDKSFKEALSICYEEITSNCGKYEKALIKAMKMRSILSIYILTLYSRLKNKEVRRGIYENNDVCP